MDEFKINPEFHKIIPPITIEEYQFLEESILKEGCRDAIITWNDYILDGINRYEICQKHDLKFKIIEKSFDNDEEAKTWIIHNQLARRNLPPYEKARLALFLKPIIEKKAKKKQKESGGAVCQKSDKPVIDTKKELAKFAGVSHDTIHKVEVIEKEASPEIKEAIHKGEMSISKGYEKTRIPKFDSSIQEDSDALFQLKRWWKKATKKDRKTFMLWIKSEKGE